MPLNRRELLSLPFVASLASLRADTKGQIVDTHTHFYDPTRPEGVPWPGKGDEVLYRKVLPAEYAKLVEPLGIRGTVVVEASPWVEDNQWLLDLAEKNPIILGVVGRLLPDSDEFEKYLKRFAKNPKFRGIRINQQEVKAAGENETTRKRLARLGDAGLTLDVNGGPELLPLVAKLAKQLPRLKIVVNHLANPLIDGMKPPMSWSEGMKAASESETVCCKLSGLVDSTRKRKREAPKEIGFYQGYFDIAWNCFGKDRLLFGSNWPVSDHYATFETLLKITQALLKPTGDEATRKILGENALRVYGLKND
jgi:predicted TIM-barrel fold metal-dependent hydrolase